jgi:hypothetical protein
MGNINKPQKQLNKSTNLTGATKTLIEDDVKLGALPNNNADLNLIEEQYDDDFEN